MRSAPRAGAATLMLAAALATTPARAHEHAVADDRRVSEAHAMMAELRAESRRDAARIVEAYGEGAAAFAFSDFAALAASAHEGVIHTLPLDEYRFNLRPRLAGAHPIGEKDLSRRHRDNRSPGLCVSAVRDRNEPAALDVVQPLR